MCMLIVAKMILYRAAEIKEKNEDEKEEKKKTKEEEIFIVIRASLLLNNGTGYVFLRLLCLGS